MTSRHDKSGLSFIVFIVFLLAFVENIGIGILISSDIQRESRSIIEEIAKYSFGPILGSIVAIYIAYKFTSKSMHKSRIDVCREIISALDKEDRLLLVRLPDQMRTAHDIFHKLQFDRKYDSIQMFNTINENYSSLRDLTHEHIFSATLIESDEYLSSSAELFNKCFVLYNDIEPHLENRALFDGFRTGNIADICREKMQIIDDIVSKSRSHHEIIERSRLAYMEEYKMSLRALDLN